MSCKSLKGTALALEDLDPALWGTLAPCLLDLVFVRLPVAQISQLRLLSKLWKAAIDSVESGFNLLLEDQVYPNLFGLIGRYSKPHWGRLCVWMFDMNHERCSVRKTDRPVDGKYTVGAANGGLVCFVSVTMKAPLIFVVMNPLTGKKVELPHLLCIYDLVPTIQPSMLHLKMNRKTNHYMVFFVGYIQDDCRGLIAQVYDSQTKEWSIVGSREKSWARISGDSYIGGNDDDNTDCYDGQRGDPCAYDFEQEELRYYIVQDEQQLTMSHAMLGDRFFYLCTEVGGGTSNLILEGCEHKHFITECRLPQGAADCVDGARILGCEPFEDYLEYDHDFILHACNGYLIVMVHNYTTIVDYLHVWLYHLSTSKWLVLPEVPGLKHFCRVEDVLMCELRWSATP